ncbi:hypothetical protein VSS74_21605 [Conexibacter stalactiti]|uniref:Uncharacterized protein n=1 Tax=Conexibacter stalactiti TaxID=1940611 RepID=A0ABU4HUG7_9ACTN|nr:hypothetical protein [Conexibacter stalactiti]MDW5596958.1 hypothetical protein [Conexibacter stalactiti]MEC5037600.1 hypothetical protein [Conexibacter stalactiti]
MPDTTQLGSAGLVGWRKAVADRVATPAANRAPVSEDQARAIVGALFFALSLYYVISTIVRMVKSQGG